MQQFVLRRPLTKIIAGAAGTAASLATIALTDDIAYHVIAVLGSSVALSYGLTGIFGLVENRREQRPYNDPLF